MKLPVVTLAAATALAASAPAVAQYGSQRPYGSQPYGNQAGVNPGAAWNLSDRIDQIEDRLEDGIDSGAIDRAETRSLRLQIRQLNRLESQYSRDGLTQDERRDLQQRIRSVRQQLRVADGGNNNNNRYADWDDDDGYRQGARYQEVNQVCAQTTTAISAILGRILGADNCLRVGERLTTNLSAVPAQFRDQFRDGGGYYYGYLEGNVVQIDARTRVVTRIYDVV